MTIGSWLFLSFLLEATLGANNEHNADTIPDSLTDPTACHAEHDGYVCDVDGKLPRYNDQTSGVQALNELITKIRKNTTCLCKQEKCPPGIGTKISVVVVEKLKMDENDTSSENILKAMKKFADEVRRKQKRGNCDDDILIALSTDYRAVRTSYGLLVSSIDRNDKLIIDSAEDDFIKQDWTNGLLMMIENYGRVLRGEPIEGSNAHHWYDPLPLWAVVVIACVVGIILLLTIGVLMVFFCRKKQGYTMGQRR